LRYCVFFAFSQLQPLLFSDDKYVNCTFLPRLNFRQQKFAVSLTYFERALDLMQKKYGHDSPPLISVFQSLGRVSSTVFDYEGLAVGF